MNKNENIRLKKEISYQDILMLINTYKEENLDE